MDSTTKMIRNMVDSASGSHRDIAKLAGISEVSISRYYRGARIPNIKTFFRIANACGYFGVNDKPKMPIDEVVKIFKNCTEDNLNARETRDYMETVLTALKIYKMFTE